MLGGARVGDGGGVLGWAEAGDDGTLAAALWCFGFLTVARCVCVGVGVGVTVGEAVGRA